MSEVAGCSIKMNYTSILKFSSFFKILYIMNDRLVSGHFDERSFKEKYNLAKKFYKKYILPKYF